MSNNSTLSLVLLNDLADGREWMNPDLLICSVSCITIFIKESIFLSTSKSSGSMDDDFTSMYCYAATFSCEDTVTRFSSVTYPMPTWSMCSRMSGSIVLLIALAVTFDLFDGPLASAKVSMAVA